MGVIEQLYGQLASHTSLIAFRVAWAGVCAVQPNVLIHNALQLYDNTLYCGGRQFLIPKNGVHLVAAGKAAGGMVTAVAGLLQNKLSGGVVSVPKPTNTERNAGLALPEELKNRLEVFEGPRDNLPDDHVAEAGVAAATLARSLGASDLLLVLLTGGGSALLSLPVSGISMLELATTTSLLSHAGFTIAELNAVRQNLDELKGGGLAAMAAPAPVLALVLSDVVGDPLEVVASGPTVAPLLGNYFGSSHCVNSLLFSLLYTIE